MASSDYRKGIILAGGNGTRLLPATYALSKHLLNVYDKPMIYYSLSTLMLAGIREILIISSPRDLNLFSDLLGNGDRFGVSLKYEIQESPKGIADAFIIGKSFIGDSSVALILGDNLLHGNELVTYLQDAKSNKTAATIFAYIVNDPQRYGIIEFDKNNKVVSIEEKPHNPKSSYAVIGLYFFDNSVVEKTSKLGYSSRGELEITWLNQLYLKENTLNAQKIGRGVAWFDTGTKDSLYEASGYIRTLQNRQGLMIGSPEEIAWRNSWISDKELLDNSELYKESDYGKYLKKLLFFN
tara:strand:+ start:14 stop:901 length:888 start_codon:yes stop_codon:yes gene_type:complete